MIPPFFCGEKLTRDPQKIPPKKVWLSCLESLHWLRDLDDLAAEIGDGGISGFVASSWPVAFVRNVGFRGGNVGPPILWPWESYMRYHEMMRAERRGWRTSPGASDALHLSVKISQNCGVSHARALMSFVAWKQLCGCWGRIPRHTFGRDKNRHYFGSAVFFFQSRGRSRRLITCITVYCSRFGRFRKVTDLSQSHGSSMAFHVWFC